MWTNGGTSNYKLIGSVESDTYAKPFTFARKAYVSHHLIVSELPTQLPARCFCYPQSIREIFAFDDSAGEILRPVGSGNGLQLHERIARCVALPTSDLRRTTIDEQLDSGNETRVV